MWDYEFYQDEEGNEPVKNFILSLDARRKGKLLQIIQMGVAILKRQRTVVITEVM